jgi:hypothetical protein
LAEIRITIELAAASGLADAVQLMVIAPVTSPIRGPKGNLGPKKG